ncbi:MAG: nucleotidyltransferase family protein [Actinomycetota bacterium]|nr:nucleotidyltransferase family protein [Actinomycetota bacterium]
MTDAGLLLAAGAGRRMGRPKALVSDERGGWLARAVDALAGCATVTVVLGAGAEEAVRLLGPYDVTVVVATDWADGMGCSLAAGLRHLVDGEATRAVVSLVDLPDVGADVVRRVRAHPGRTETLARATYLGHPGHPVLLGRDHWVGVLTTCTGDEGARAYLAAHDVTWVECGDLASGQDVDRPPNPGPTARA